jgi:hypothetical protein
MDRARLLAEAKVVMRAIVAVAGSPGDPDAVINASFMFPALRTDFTAELVRDVRFVGHNRNPKADLWGVLRLEEWAEDVSLFGQGLVLPLEDLDNELLHDRLLPGAPEAFMYNQTTEVDDTLRPVRRHVHSSGRERKPGEFVIPHEVPDAVYREMIQYFEGKATLLRSFVSIPLRIPPGDHERVAEAYRDKPLAVFNLQSSQPRAFVFLRKRRNLLSSSLLPLLSILSCYLSRIRWSMKEQNAAN